MDPTAGPSSQPLQQRGGSNTSLDVGSRPGSPVANGDSAAGFKGKGKEIDWDAVRLVNLGSVPSTGPSTGASSSSTHFLGLSPVPSPSHQNSIITVDQIPARRRISKDSDSSNLDFASSTTLPMGRPLPDPTTSQPPAKKFRPLGPTPLPPGPPTIQHLRILLEPEHVDMNRPKQFFDYLRKRDNQPPRLELSPAEIKEMLDKMKRVNEIWLRTMGEDEGCVACIAGWLGEFISSKNPRLYEGIVSPAIWVILKAKPPLKVLKSKRVGTLAQQCLEIAKRQNLPKKDDIEKVVQHLEQLLALAKKNASSNSTSAPSSGNATAASSSSVAAGPFAPSGSQPSFGRTTSDRTLPVRPAPSAASSSTSMPAMGTNPIASGVDLSKLLASVMPIVNNMKPKAEATSGPSQRPPPPFMVRPKIEPGVSQFGSDPSRAQTPSAGPSTGFRPAPGPTPMIVKREPGLLPPNAANTNTNQARGSYPGPSSATLPHAGFASSDGNPSYPGVNNRWSSVATPAGVNRPFDGKKKPNWRNHIIRYRDEALAEARFFVQDEGEEEWDPYWWKYGKLGESGQSGGNLDRDEGRTMKHLHGHEPAIEWYDPPVYDTQATTVQPVYTAECQDQDQRERPILGANYRTQAAIPPCPDESNVRNVQLGYGTLYIPEVPRAYIPRPQPLPPQMAMYQPQPQRPPLPPQPAQGYGNAYRPREAPPQSHPVPTATSSSFRPRNPPPPAQGSSGMSSAYRPRDRGASAPAQVAKQEPVDPPVRRATTPGPGGNVIIKSWESDSNNPAPALDLQGTIRYWRREMRPRRSALLNPLSAQQIAHNLEAVNNAPPFDYAMCQLAGEGDEEAEWKPGPAFQG